MIRKILFTAILLIILVAPFVFAEAPGSPHQFYGSVLVNGKPVDNVLIIAKLNSTEVAATTSSAGKYGYKPDIFYIEDPLGDRNGKTIEFFIRDFAGNEVKAGQDVFVNAESTQLDFSVTMRNFCGDKLCESSESCSLCSQDCGVCPTNNNQNPGVIGPGSEIQPGEENENETKVCVPDWQCTEWQDCINGKEKRACIDANKCNGARPEEIQNCTSTICGNGVCEENENCPGDCSKGPTGSLIADPLSVPIIVALIIIIIILNIEFMKKRKNK